MNLCNIYTCDVKFELFVGGMMCGCENETKNIYLCTRSVAVLFLSLFLLIAADLMT